MSVDPKLLNAMVLAAMDEWFEGEDWRNDFSAMMRIKWQDDMRRAILGGLRAVEAWPVPHKLVGREAELDMLNAGWEKMFGATAGPTSEVWYAMFDAAPGAGE